jgi:hypothetical protein
MSAVVLRFPSSRAYGVRVERERDGDAWIVLVDACGWLHGDFATALSDAREIGAGFGLPVVSSAGRLP